MLTNKYACLPNLQSYLHCVFITNKQFFRTVINLLIIFTLPCFACRAFYEISSRFCFELNSLMTTIESHSTAFLRFVRPLTSQIPDDFESSVYHKQPFHCGSEKMCFYSFKHGFLFFDETAYIISFL